MAHNPTPARFPDRERCSEAMRRFCMHIGVTVPLTEFGADLVGLRDFVQAVEELGYAPCPPP